MEPIQAFPLTAVLNDAASACRFLRPPAEVLESALEYRLIALGWSGPTATYAAQDCGVAPALTDPGPMSPSEDPISLGKALAAKRRAAGKGAPLTPERQGAIDSLPAPEFVGDAASSVKTLAGSRRGALSHARPADVVPDGL